MVGNLMYLSSPFTSFYEFVRFGKYSAYTAVDGINQSDIPVLIMHSKDDLEIPYNLSIASKSLEITNPLAKIHVFENKKHDITLSDAALAYRTSNQTEMSNIENADTADNSLNSTENSSISEELDLNVMNEIVEFFNEALEN